MNKLNISIGLLLLATATFFSCKKKDSTPVAGKGGNASVYLTLAHHSLESYIYDAKVYIKYDATDMPTDGKWDDSVDCAHLLKDTSQTALFTNLKNGNYYFFAQGNDSLWKLPVKGGFPYTISQQTTQKVDLAVDEYYPGH